MLEKIGSGGMSRVYRAKQRELNRIVALKVCKSAASSGDAISRGFAAEAQLICAAKHEHIAYAMMAAIDPSYDRAFYAMEFIDGPSAEEVLLAQQRMSERSTLELGLAMASALESLHKIGIVHLDVKPANMIYMQSGVLKLIDFGIAREIEKLRADPPKRLEGTPFYMAPEQAGTIPDSVDGQTDLYALGCTLYQMLTGKVPYSGESIKEIALAHLDGDVPRVDASVSEVSKPVADLVAKLMQRKKSARMISATVLVAAIRELLENKPAKPAATAVKTPARRLRFRMR